MALTKFIPKVWSARLLSNLQKAHVFTQAGVVNRDYQGEISQAGDTVYINSIGPVSVGDYTVNTKIGDPQVLTDAQKVLTIDQQKFFNFMVDDVDQAQAKGNVMDEAMKESSYALADISDNYVAGLYTGVDSANTIGSVTSPASVDENTIYEALLALKKRLDDAKVSKQGRWAVLPTWAENLVLRAKIITDTNPQQHINNGVIGRVAGFTLLTSLNVPQVTDATAGTSDVIIAGHPSAISFAEQIVDVKAYEPEQYFADAVKGLHVYGGKLIRTEGIATLTAQNGSTSTF